MDRTDSDTFARPSSEPLALRLTPPAERAVRAGHPWIFGNGVRSVSRAGRAGDVAVVFDRKNRFLAVGLFDPEGPIRVRVLRQGKPAKVNAGFFREALARAMEVRRDLREDPRTTGYRVVHGEGDGMGGLVLDRYGDAAVLKLYTSAWTPHLRDLVPAIEELLAPRTLLALVSRRVAERGGCPPALRSGALLLGKHEGEGIPFLEAGLRFEAHPLLGHKTGFYLDQRDNRARAGQRAANRRVLNVFSYTGGFSLYAALKGAREVVSVDASGPALEQAERHFDLNRDQIGEVPHRTVKGDAFEVLAELKKEGERFDLVIVDPPSFAHAESQREPALEAYAALTRLALGVLVPGGRLVQASCSSRVSAEEFFAGVHRAARAAGRPLEEEARTGHPGDHPVPASFPEGAYLKCLFGRTA